MEVVDARGLTIRLAGTPRRIVSLVPSTTETLLDLGAPVVGVTRFCVHPEAARALPRIGGTKDVNAQRVRDLQPDLIVGNCEENSREIFDAMAGIAPLFAAFPRTVDQAIADLRTLGTLVDAHDAARRWITRIERARPPEPHGARPRVAALIWRRPWMAVGADTFIHGMLDALGLDNAFADRPERYPTLTEDDLRAADPELVLLTTEPFPFHARHADELAARTGLPRARFRRADGELLSWHGTRMALAFEQLSARSWPELR